MGIDTGYFKAGRGSGCLVVSSAPSSGANIVFSSSVPYNNVESFIFDVKPGQVLVFDAYNILEGAVISLERLITGSRQTVADGCGAVVHPGIIASTSVLYWKPMTLFGTARWQLRSDQDMLALTIPGTYRWRLEDETMVDNDLYVEYTVYREDCLIPEAFRNGGLV